MTKKLLIAVFAFLSALPAFCEVINIYHTSDTHGFYFPREVKGRRIGGFAALAALLARDGGPRLLLDSGDWTSGTAEAKDSKGLLSVQFMNMLGYNAATIGNHELDFEEDAMLKNIERAKFDILAANIYDVRLKGLPAHVKPFKIYMAGGRKIAVIGIAKDFGTDQKRFRISKDRKALKNALRRLAPLQPDAVVLLDHNSIDDDRHSDPASPAALIKGIGGIDLVLGGHMHKIIQNAVIDGVVFVESGIALDGVSKISLDFEDNGGGLKSIKSEYIELDTGKTGEDFYVKEFAEANRHKALDAVISKANETIFKYLPEAPADSPKTAKQLDSPLADIFADLIKEYAAADIGVLNTGAIRKDLPRGPITKRLVSEISPFPDKIMTVEVNGDFLKKLVRDSLKGGKSLFQYSANMRVRYIMKGKKKPQDIEITINGETLDGKKMYSLALRDYIALGNSEGYMFKKITNRKPAGDKTFTDLFLDYLQKNPQGIKGAQTGRIIMD
ncbi:MAG: bifunctional metallophosphatase/5'-nucleotidase [Elusimicrobiota bacterium]|jgi:2',3'-cyclic-nucleotide 2'-phosphodiesterase (5'-nucleotidase family)|nr:bifunctional metallophosphatase/5'-nucleotidase [Elusimicrobiota bacterium]